MKSIIKAEFLKLLTVRSTYIATGLSFLFIAFMTFFVVGIRGADGASTFNPKALADVAIQTSSVAIIAAIIAVLFMAHEYRYNLITYTLSASNSRTKSLLAKILVIAAYSFFYAVVGTTLGIIMYRLGLAVSGKTLAPQDFDLLNIYGRLIFYTVGFSLVGLLFTVLFRNLALSIVMLFMLPSTLEGLLSLLLKENTKYLPFSALGQVIMPNLGNPDSVSLSPGKAALIFTIYLIVGWVITWYLFLKRDAN